MTLNATHAAFMDADLRARVDASVWQEAFYRAANDDPYAENVLKNTAATFTPFYWRVAIDYTAAYEAAVQNGRGAPGHDTDIITDANIAAAIAAAWPVEVTPA